VEKRTLDRLISETLMKLAMIGMPHTKEIEWVLKDLVKQVEEISKGNR
jgi:hypothetical protein